MTGASTLDDPLLAVEVGGRTVRAHLQAAIANGGVVLHDDGTLELAPGKPRTGDSDVEGSNLYIGHPGDFRQPCVFLNDFLFDQAYGQAAVPFHCRNCYKVKVVSGNLRQLMAVKEIAEELPQNSKSGVEADDPYTPHVFCTYVYNLGLERARRAYKTLRARIDKHKDLGSGVTMLIKRGCSNYERKCGPSDRYTFDPRLEAVEKFLLSRFRRRPSPTPDSDARKVQDGAKFLQMVRTAFRIGDPTYKDFTKGESVHPPTVTYSPD